MFEQIKIYASLTLLVVFSVWFIFSIDPEANLIPVVSQKSPDYYMEGFFATAFDNKGRIKQRFGAERMVHFPADNHSELNGVLIAAKLEPQGQWEIRAGRGLAKSGSDIIDLDETIKIEQIDGQQAGLTIAAAAMTIDIGNREAFSRHPVTIQSAQGEVDSIGMHIDLTERTVKLTSQVRAFIHER